nr:chlorophyll(ide) b reductase NOL, chloroplastic-like isoform X2 [Ziziphus jujuba var. spinosa]
MWSHSLPSPLFQQNPYSHSLYHCTFPTVSFPQAPPHRLMSMYGKWVFNSLIVRSKSKPSINRELMLPPYNVLITGSTKGIGYALAKEFLKAGDNVVIYPRSDGVESAVQQL